MAKYYFTRKAVDDLSEIWNYTRLNWSEAQADKYYKSLIKTCKDIARNPGPGRKYIEIAPGLSGFKSGRHILFYRKIDSETIEITRILHERMDLKTRIGQ